MSSTKGFRKTLPRHDYEHPDYETLQPYRLRSKRTKYFSDHLGPLRRYLYSQVGRRWDDVYSNLCQRLNTQTLAGQHVLSHVWGFVERHVEIVDGKPYRKDRCWSPRYLYVHPDTGLLCQATRSPSAPTRPDPDVRVVNRYHQYRRLGGVWFAIHFQEFGPHLTRFDLLQRTIITRSEAVALYGHGIYASQKRQCSKKDLKQLSLPRA
jgi:hypothetical protein